MHSSTLADQRAIHETCAFCPKLCRFACPVAEAEARETVTPWGLMTRADDVRRGALALDRDTAESWAHCTGCGRCTQICKHDNPVATALFAARAEAVAQTVAPAALLAWGAAEPPACARFEALPASGPTRLFPGQRLAEDWPGGPNVVDFITFIAAHVRPPKVPVIAGDVLYLDACRLGRGRGEYDAARAVLQTLIGGDIIEATMNRAEGGCCGAGAGFAAVAPESANDVAREFAQDRASIPVVIAQPGCAAHLEAALAPRPVYALTTLLARAIAKPSQTPR